MAVPEQTTETQASQPSDAMMSRQSGDETLASQYDDDETAGFQPDQVEVNRGREQGLGMGERELNAQGDVGNVVAADEDEVDEDLEDEDDQAVLDEILDENTAVLGDDEDEEDGAGV